MGEYEEDERDSFLDQCCRHQAIFTHFFIVLAAVRELTNMPIMNVELLKLGLRIRASRKMLGLNQKDFSEECGLDRSYFGGVERGERNLTFSSLCQICAGLNCDIAAVTKGIPHLTDTPK
jgi:DNA-binding Xre family transcriptional regulator